MQNIADTETSKSYSSLFSHQRNYISSHNLKTYQQRKAVLLQIKNLIKENENEILEALKKDMNRPETEAYGAEIIFLYNEINFHIKHLKHWMRPKKVCTSLVNQIGSSYIITEPYGSVLVISPWNYPIQLILSPAIGAIAAGNAVILKPSEVATHCEQLMKKLINSTFPAELLHVVTGGPDETQALIHAKPDYIFFTGSNLVGSLVAQSAAKYLIPITIEAGGKTPCVVNKGVNLKVAARRILWGKCFNAGQTCIAPDYLLVHESILQDFLKHYKKAYQTFYNGNAITSGFFSRIIDQRHYNRLKAMLTGNIIHGGRFDDKNLSIEPTLILLTEKDHPAMKEEIFGPIMPVFTFTEAEEVLQMINDHPKALTLYLFSGSSAFNNSILINTSSGTVLINDTLLHYASNYLPFGGVGKSGIGKYHGEQSFATFSHKRGIIKKLTWPDPLLRYPPYKYSWRKIEKFLLWLAK